MIDNEGTVIRPPLCRTFTLPSHEDLLAVRCGDIVKLVFEGPMPERMWVCVTEQRSPREWFGILDNEPLVIDAIQYSARIRFHPLDVIDIYPE